MPSWSSGSTSSSSEKVKRFVRARSVERAGIGFSLHSDFTVTDPNPLHMIQLGTCDSC
jgi:predicted amidohydrolase YtcJ